MKLLILVFLCSIASLGARANNINETKACTSVAAQAVRDYDWQVHEDDFNEAVVLESSVVQDQKRIEYVIRAGRSLKKDGSANSTYKAIVEPSNNERFGVGAKVSCEVLDIKETRKR